MCWNRNVSIVAAIWGWVACALLAQLRFEKQTAYPLAA